MMNGRKKPISAEEELLFRGVLQDAKPLKKRQRIVLDSRVRPEVFNPSARYGSTPAFNEGIALPIGGHADGRLRRGRLDPEARIDLHGMTHDGAYRALVGFLMTAQAEGKRLVLVITGKGGVLRARLPLWLGQAELQPLVVGVREAHVRHGGSGAFYVALRKPKRNRMMR